MNNETTEVVKVGDVNFTVSDVARLVAIVGDLPTLALEELFLKSNFDAGVIQVVTKSAKAFQNIASTIENQ